VRTNNNTDNTAEILENWICKNKHLYKEVCYNKEDVKENVQQFKHREWNAIRFHVLGHIRQKSIDFAIERCADYFVCDCDNLILPNTLQMLYNSTLSVVGPLLRRPGMLYSNYHNVADRNGYMKHSPHYNTILSQNIKGLINVDVIHCTYLIRNHILPLVSYDDNTMRYEYVIFSDTMRRKGIPQYLDNRQIYGLVSFALTAEETHRDLYGFKKEFNIKLL
jgi:hypothetical protein